MVFVWWSEVVEFMIDLWCQIGDVKIMDDMVDLIGEVRGKEYFDWFCGVMVVFVVEEEGLMLEWWVVNDQMVVGIYQLIIWVGFFGFVFSVVLGWVIG